MENIKKNLWWSSGFVVDGNKVICTRIEDPYTDEISGIYRTHESAKYVLEQLAKSGKVEYGIFYVKDIEKDIDSGNEKTIYSYCYVIENDGLKLKSKSIIDHHKVKFEIRLQSSSYTQKHIVEKLEFSECICNNHIFHAWSTNYRPAWILKEENIENNMVLCCCDRQKWVRPRTTYSDID